MKRFLVAFSVFHQMIFSFLVVHGPQQFFFLSHSPTKETLNVELMREEKQYVNLQPIETREPLKLVREISRPNINNEGPTIIQVG